MLIFSNYFSSDKICDSFSTQLLQESNGHGLLDNAMRHGRARTRVIIPRQIAREADRSFKDTRSCEGE